jgi:hypothetical protein
VHEKHECNIPQLQALSKSLLKMYDIKILPIVLFQNRVIDGKFGFSINLFIYQEQCRLLDILRTNNTNSVNLLKFSPLHTLLIACDYVYLLC